MLQADFIDRRWRHPALLPLFFLALALLMRSFSFVAAVIDTDEGLYMLQAREWLEGRWPITAVWDMHPVGAPAIFAVFMAIFGDGIWVLRALGAFGFGSLGISESDLTTEGRVIQLGFPPRRIDILTSIDGVSWSDARAHAMSTTISGIPILVISRSDLAANKRAVGRPQDLADAARLEQQ
jgi:hypothetical protein